MRKGWVWLLVAACFLLVVVLVGVGLSAVPRPIAPPQRMPDGSLAIPLGFTVGDTKHRWVEGSALQRVLGRILPPSVAAALGAQVHEYTTHDATTPVLWIRYLGSNPNHRYYASRKTVLDSDGCESQQAIGGGSFVTANPSESLEAIPLTPLNRRDPEIRLRFFSYANHGRRQDAEFKLRNPVFSTAPRWTPQPLPTSATDGPLTVTLDEVVTRCDMSKPPRPAGIGQDAWTLFRAHTSENGKRNENWDIADVEFSDATGNAGSSGTSNISVEGGEIRYFMGTTLCPREPAWKIRLEMSRRAGFAPGELWTIRNLPLPAAKERKVIGQQSVLQGVTLKCVDFRGGQAPPEEGGTNFDTPALQFRALGWHPGLRMTLVSVTDDRGRKVHNAGSSASSTGRFWFGLRPLPDARSLTVTVAVSPSRYVEFLTRSSLPAGAAPAR